MTIQELKTREENRKKNKKLIQEGRLVVVEVGENYTQKRVFVDGVDVFPFWERDHKKHLSKYDFLQLKEQAIQRQEEAKRQEEKRQEEQKQLIATLNSYGYNLRQEENGNFTIYRVSDDMVISYHLDYSKKMIAMLGREYLDNEARKQENTLTNENDLKAKENAGLIKWAKFGYFTDKRTNKIYSYGRESLNHDFTEKGGFVNWIIERTNAREEEEKREEEERKAKQAEVIAILEKNGVKYNTIYNAFYFKRSKVAQMESWQKIISFNNYYNSYKLHVNIKKIFDDLELDTSTIETGKEERK